MKVENNINNYKTAAVLHVDVHMYLYNRFNIYNNVLLYIQQCVIINKFNIMFGFTDWFSSIVTYVMSWYEKFDDISDGDSEEEWGQFVVIDEEKI